MDFITTGNRIAVENFSKGCIYTITFTSGLSIIASCTGIGSNFVMFISSSTPKLFTLSMTTAVTVSEIEIYTGNDYEDLINKPSINNVELVGALSLIELGIQAALSTAQLAAADSGITAALVEQISINAANLLLKQDLIDSSHKLSSDLVDDTNNTNKFATAAQLAQIATNKTNISSLSGHFTFSANSKHYYLQPEQPSSPAEGDIWIG